jgi:hypothetical protein
MKKRFVKAGAFALLVVFLVVLLPIATLAAPETRTVNVPAGDSSFTIELTVDGGSLPYAGIEFGMTVADENAMRFVSFVPNASISDAMESPFVTKDGVHYFGFFTNENAFSGRFTVGTLHFDGYTGRETATLTLSYMNVNRLLEDNNPVGQKNSEAILVITVRRASSGNVSGIGNPIVIDVPNPDAPVAGTDRDQYIDVTDVNAWYYDAVYYVTDAGLMNGTGGNHFSPDIPLTRAMFVTILGRLAEQQGEKTMEFNNPFHDVPAVQYYTQYVAWAADKGIARGHSATRFAPDEPVTREQMAALMIRFCEHMDVALRDDINITFSDAGEIGEWAKDVVNRAAATGLMQGSNGHFRPQATATRAEVAQVFMNFLKAYME